jgi:hypothetical protein
VNVEPPPAASFLDLALNGPAEELLHQLNAALSA